MRSFITFGVTVLIIIVVLTFMMTFSVRFTESAVVTTFDRATENSVVSDARSTSDARTWRSTGNSRWIDEVS